MDASGGERATSLALLTNYVWAFRGRDPPSPAAWLAWLGTATALASARSSGHSPSPGRWPSTWPSGSPAGRTMTSTAGGASDLGAQLCLNATPPPTLPSARRNAEDSGSRGIPWQMERHTDGGVSVAAAGRPRRERRWGGRLCTLGLGRFTQRSPPFYPNNSKCGGREGCRRRAGSYGRRDHLPQQDFWSHELPPAPVPSEQASHMSFRATPGQRTNGVSRRGGESDDHWCGSSGIQTGDTNSRGWAIGGDALSKSRYGRKLFFGVNSRIISTPRASERHLPKSPISCSLLA